MAENDKMQALYGSFKRLRDFPLDPSCIFDTEEDMKTYAHSKTNAYAGQVVVVLSGDNKGIYYLLDDPDTGLLSYVKAIDVDDETTFLEELAKLKQDFNETREELGQSLADMYAQIGNEFVTKSAFEKVTNLNTAEIEEIVDSLGEVILILNDFNTAIYHAPSFRRITSDINKIRKLIPVELNDGLYDTEFNPTQSQKLVTNAQLDTVKEFVAHTEKVISFKAESLTKETTGTWSSPVLGTNNNGFTITQIKVVIPALPVNTISKINDFKIRVGHSNKELVSTSDFISGYFYNPDTQAAPADCLPLEPISFIYELEEHVVQDSTIVCSATLANIECTIFIKYFE